MLYCMISPLFVAAVNADFPKWLKRFCVGAILSAALALILTISRAGVATFMLVMLGATLVSISFKVTFKKVAIGGVVLLLAAGMFAKAWHLSIMARCDEQQLETGIRRQIAEPRLLHHDSESHCGGSVLWRGDLNCFKVLLGCCPEYGPKLGWHFVPYIGTEHWPSDVVPPGRNLDAAQAAPAHNLGALTVGELGLPGLFLFSLLWMRWFQMGASFLLARSTDPTVRIGAGIFFCTLGIFLQSLTEWVYRLTPIFFTFNILMGTLASLYHLKRERKRKTIEEAEEIEEEYWPMEAFAHNES